MSIADELRKLQELHRHGALTDEEFTQAKAALLNTAGSPPVPFDPTKVDVDEALAPQQLRGVQIIASALLMGVVAFLALVLVHVFVQNNGQGLAPPGGLPILSLLAVAMLAVCAPLAFVIPRIQTQSALRQIISGSWQLPPGFDPMLFATSGAKLMAVRHSTLILGLALLEGPAFLACIAYLLEAQAFALGLIGVAIALMLYKFPTESRVRTWLERQVNQLAELHQ
jgi:Short C-terminal domain